MKDREFKIQAENRGWWMQTGHGLELSCIRLAAEVQSAFDNANGPDAKLLFRGFALCGASAAECYLKAALVSGGGGPITATEPKTGSPKLNLPSGFEHHKLEEMASSLNLSLSADEASLLKELGTWMRGFARFPVGKSAARTPDRVVTPIALLGSVPKLLARLVDLAGGRPSSLADYIGVQ